MEEKASPLLDKFAEVSSKIGNQVHLRSLRDAFATMTPVFILAGIAVLINNVVFPLFLAGDPEEALEAAPKQYVDGLLTVPPGASWPVWWWVGADRPISVGDDDGEVAWAVHAVDADQLDVAGGRGSRDPRHGTFRVLSEHVHRLGHRGHDRLAFQHAHVLVRDQGDGPASLVRLAVEHDRARDRDTQA